MANMTESYSTIQNSVIDLGEKYFKFVNSGYLNYPKKQVVGTWYLKWYKGSNTSEITINFISTKINTIDNSQIGYDIRFNSNEAVHLRKCTGSANSILAITANSYLAINTWYEMKITNSDTGGKIVYARGGSLGNKFIQILTATDNTYILSDWFIAFSSENNVDLISDVRFYPIIK